MSAHSQPYATIQRAIPVGDRERVWVEALGSGITEGRLTLGANITGICVRLDDSSMVIAAPSEVRPYVDDARSNVVMFPNWSVAR